MKVLVTGGMGFIGSHTVEAFLDAGHDVVATYYETWRVPSFLEPHVGKRLVYEQADVGAAGVVLGLVRRHGVDGIVHLAIHGRAQADAGEDLRANMDKISLLLDAARESGVKPSASPARRPPTSACRMARFGRPIHCRWSPWLRPRHTRRPGRYSR